MSEAKPYALTVHLVKHDKSTPLFESEGKWTRHFDSPVECREIYLKMLSHYRANPNDYAIEPTLYKRCKASDLCL